jgi:hypothetical protein
MQEQTFMYGDLSRLGEPAEPIITVLLIGFDGRRRVLTGTHQTLWNEFMHGDGGQSNDNTPDGGVGYEYWCRQPLGTLDHEASASSSIETIVAKKG